MQERDHQRYDSTTRRCRLYRRGGVQWFTLQSHRLIRQLRSFVDPLTLAGLLLRNRSSQCRRPRLQSSAYRRLDNARISHVPLMNIGTRVYVRFSVLYIVVVFRLIQLPTAPIRIHSHLQVGLRQAKYMVRAEFIVVAVPCEFNRLFLLPPEMYVVARSTKVRSNTMNPERSQSCRRDGLWWPFLSSLTKAPLSRIRIH